MRTREEIEDAAETLLEFLDHPGCFVDPCYQDTMRTLASVSALLWVLEADNAESLAEVFGQALATAARTVLSRRVQAN